MNPTRVLDPSLIYDSKPADFVSFLCTLGYDEISLHQVTRDDNTYDTTFNTTCDLNYPSIVIPNLKDNFLVTRIVICDQCWQSKKCHLLSPWKWAACSLTRLTSAIDSPGILEDGGPIETAVKHLASCPLYAKMTTWCEKNDRIAGLSQSHVLECIS